MARAGEDELIARFFAPLAGPGALSLQDDAAVVAPPPGRDLVLTADALVAGIHFRPDDPPSDIGWKALAVNLSDLAAKGADPLGFLLTLALPADWTEEWLADFSAGLAELSRASGCVLLGGDTVRAAGALTLSVTALGSVPTGRAVRRTTARAADLVAVTGTIGDAVLGLALGDTPRPAFADGLAHHERAFLLDRYRRPRPRNRFAGALRTGANAAMDVSDGLVGDLSKLLRASGLGGTLHLDRAPLSRPAAQVVGRDPALLERLLSGGDDYEILLTAPPHAMDRLLADAERLDLALTVVGEVGEPGAGLTLLDAGEPVSMQATSFSHF